MPIRPLTHRARTNPPRAWIWSSPEAQSEAGTEAAKPQDQALLGRGVRMRTLYLDSVRNSPATVAHAGRLTELNGEVRTTPSLPIRMMLLDRRIAIVPTGEEDSRAGALVLSASGTVTALCALFETIWDSAGPLGGASSRDRQDERGLSPSGGGGAPPPESGPDRRSVAKRLGVSPRTARRIAADLMEELGARSRFQAGSRAVAKGRLTGEEREPAPPGRARPLDVSLFVSLIASAAARPVGATTSLRRQSGTSVSSPT